MRINPPYPLLFAPPIATTGSPIIADRSNPPPDSWFLHLASNRTSPSSARALRSFGVQSRPVDAFGRPLSRPSTLILTPSINIRVPFFYTSGSFAAARTEAFFQIFVEEFDASNRFVRGVVNPFELLVVRQDFFWVSGSQTFAPLAWGPNFVIPNPANGILTAQPGFLYRIWIDLTARISAAGFGFGGSAAVAQLGWTIDSIDVLFL